MLLHWRSIPCLALIGSLLAAPAAAQTIPSAELPAHISIGDFVSLRQFDGGRTDGQVIDLSASSLTLLVDDREKQTVPSAAVRRVVVWDSLKNGTLIGLVAGAIPGAAVGLAIRTACENEVGGCASLPFATAAFFGGIGAGIGAGVDALIRRSIDVRRPPGASVTLAPVITPGARAMLVSVRF